MKKVLLITTVAVAMAGLTAFGQGQFNFSSGGRFVWNNLGSSGVPGGAFNVAFLMTATGSTISNSAVGTLTGHSLIPTNNATGGGSQGSAYQPSPNGTAEWNAILSDPNFSLGRDQGNASAVAVGTLTPTGGITYNVAAPFTAAGTSAGGGDVYVFFIAWSNAFATPAAAQAGNSVLGWSTPFKYHYEATGQPPGAMGAASLAAGVDAHFGVAPVIVPEPTTFALTGLGAAALLIFRRRK